VNSTLVLPGSQAVATAYLRHLGLDIQNQKGKAKAYQVRQVLLAIEKMGLEHGA